MTRAAWFHCGNGISGDMTLGALVGAGADQADMEVIVRHVQPAGWRWSVSTVDRGGIRATRVAVEADDGPPRRAGDILDQIAAASLPGAVGERAARAVEALAAAEAVVHGATSARDVHLHEAGAIDAVVDIVGAMAGLHLLGIDVVYSTAVGAGAAVVPTRHGPITTPGPAVVELLKGAPVRLLDSNIETVTPTGAAILRGAGARFGEEPVITIESQGFGAGGRDPSDRPNVVAVIVGTATATRQDLVVVEANVDDATPEVLAHAAARLLEVGAADAWLSPVVMKKGRPGVTVHALCRPEQAADVEGLLLAETGSFGARRYPVSRRALARDWVTVDVDGYAVRVKRAVEDGRVVHAAAEFEDARTAAAALGRPLAMVMAEAVVRTSSAS